MMSEEMDLRDKDFTIFTNDAGYWLNRAKFWRFQTLRWVQACNALQAKIRQDQSRLTQTQIADKLIKVGIISAEDMWKAKHPSPEVKMLINMHHDFSSFGQIKSNIQLRDMLSSLTATQKMLLLVEL